MKGKLLGHWLLFLTIFIINTIFAARDNHIKTTGYQEFHDSLQFQKLYRLFNHAYKNDLDSALNIAKSTTQLAGNLRDTRAELKAILMEGKCYEHNSSAEKVMRYYKKGHDVAVGLKDTLYTVIFLKESGDYLSKQKDFSDALKNYFEAEKLLARFSNDTLLLRIYKARSKLYRENNDFEYAARYSRLAMRQAIFLFNIPLFTEALLNHGDVLSGSDLRNDTITRCYLMAITLAKEFRQNTLLAESYRKFSEFYRKKGKTNVALQYGSLAYNTALKTGDKFLIASVVTGLAYLYGELKAYNNQMILHQFAFKLMSECKSPINENIISLDISDTYLNQGNYSEALKFALKSCSFFEQIHHTFFLYTTYNKLLGLYSRQNNFNKACLYVTKYENIKKEYDDITDKARLFNLQSRFDDSQISNKDREKELERSFRSRRRLVILITIIILAIFLFAIFAFIRFRNNAQIRKRTIGLEEQININTQKLADELILSEKLVKNLEEAQTRFFFLENNIRDVIVRYDAKGILTYVTPSCEIFYGYKPDEVVGKTAVDFIHPDFISNIMEEYAVMLKEKTKHIFTYQALRKDGSAFWVEAVSSPAYDDAGKLTEIVSVLREITERKRLDAAMELTKETINLSSDATFFINRKGIITYINDKARELIGKPPENKEIIYIWDLDRNITEVSWIVFWNRFLKDKPLVLETTYNICGGNSIPVELYLNYNSHNEDEFMIIYATDISSRKKNESELEENRKMLEKLVAERSAELFRSENNYRALIENVGSEIAMIDSDYRFVYVNEHFAGSVNMSSDYLLGRYVKDVFPPDLTALLIGAIDDTLRKETDFKSLIRRGWDNKHKWYDVIVKPLYDNILDKTFALLIQNDVTEQTNNTERVNASEAKLRAVIRNLFSAFVYIDRNLRVRMFNDRIDELFSGVYGKHIEEEEGILDYFTQQDPQEYNDLIIRCFEGENIKKEEIFTTRHGQRMYSEIYMYPVMINQSPDGVAIYIIDITERKKQEQKLTQKEARYKAIVDNSFDCILIFNPFKIKYINQRIIKLTGYGEDELLELNPLNLYYFEDREMVAEYTAKLLDDEMKSARFNARWITREGKELVLEFMETPIIYDGAKAIHCIARDLTEERRLSEELFKSKEKMFLNQLTPHFIFNTLTAIQSYIYQNTPDEAAPFISHFATLMKLYLINTKKDFITISEEAEILKYYIQLQQLRFPDKFDYSIRILNNSPLDISLIEIPPMLTQPLIENAIEHGMLNKTVKGRIDIIFNIDHERISLTVIDDGPGLEYSRKMKGKSEHLSVSTKIITERLFWLNKKYDSQATFLIDEIKDEKGNVKGARSGLEFSFHSHKQVKQGGQ